MQRIKSLDILRGVVMVLMAIDHVRVYSGMPAGGPELGIFFTRWITHFCVPAFVFFAGTAAFLNGYGDKSTYKLSRFLLVRGFLLVLLEITIIRFFWCFNFNYGNFFLAGVIWMLGWCMVLMALLVKLKPLTVGIIGVAIIVCQQVFHFVPGIFPVSIRPSFAMFWNFIYPSGMEGPAGISILYVVVPWIGVMAAGYGFGLILIMNPQKRRRICVSIGLGAIALFIILGTGLIYFDPGNKDKTTTPFLFQLLNQRKYPASQLYLLMTLGPVIALLPYAEKARGWLADVFSVFGRVPMFYYLLHILLIHISALLVNIIMYGNAHQQWYSTAPYSDVPEHYRWGLPILYLVFFLDVIILYFACKWYAGIKQRSQNKWLRLI